MASSVVAALALLALRAAALLSAAGLNSSSALFDAWPGVLFIETLKPAQPDFVCTAVLIAHTVLLTAPACFGLLESARTDDTSWEGATTVVAPRPVHAGDATRTLVGHTLRQAYVNTPSIEGGRLSVVQINRSAASLVMDLRPIPILDGQLYPPQEGLVAGYGPDSITRFSETSFNFSGVRSLKTAPLTMDALGTVSAPVGRCGYTLTGGVLSTNKPSLLPEAADAWVYLCGNVGDLGAPFLVLDARPAGQHAEAGAAALSGYGNWSSAALPLFGAPTGASGVWKVAGIMTTADTLYPCATRSAVFTSLAFRGTWVDEAVQRLSRPGGVVEPPVCPSATPSPTPTPSASESPPPTPTPAPTLSLTPPHTVTPPFPWLAIIASVVGVLTCGGGLHYWRVHARSRPDASVRVLDAGALASLPKPTLDSRAEAAEVAAAAAAAAALREGAFATTAATHHRAFLRSGSMGGGAVAAGGAPDVTLLAFGRFSQAGHERACGGHASARVAWPLVADGAPRPAQPPPAGQPLQRQAWRKRRGSGGGSGRLSPHDSGGGAAAMEAAHGDGGHATLQRLGGGAAPRSARPRSAPAVGRRRPGGCAAATSLGGGHSEHHWQQQLLLQASVAAQLPGAAERGGGDDGAAPAGGAPPGGGSSLPRHDAVASAPYPCGGIGGSSRRIRFDGAGSASPPDGSGAARPASAAAAVPSSAADEAAQTPALPGGDARWAGRLGDLEEDEEEEGRETAVEVGREDSDPGGGGGGGGGGGSKWGDVLCSLEYDMYAGAVDSRAEEEEGGADGGGDAEHVVFADALGGGGGNEHARSTVPWADESDDDEADDG